MGYAKGVPRARVMWFCTNCYALDGTKILTLRDAEAICNAKARSIEQYALIAHDKDIHDEHSISERENHKKQTYMECYKQLAKARNIPVDASNPSGYVYNQPCEIESHKWADYYYPDRQVGDAKEEHIHVVLKFKSARALNEIAKWFGIPVNMIDIVNGKGAFDDCAEYLIHKKQVEKAQYQPSEVIANFDYIAWLDNKMVKDELHGKYHMHIDDLNDIVNEVAVNGLSLRNVEDMISAPIFLRNKKLFTDARAKYIYEKAIMPPVRFVFYVDSDGKAGAGKSVVTKALCKQFATKEYGANPMLDIGQLNDYIYKAGQQGVAWDKYDGQPIVYIDDRNARDLLFEFGGHDGVKNLFERFPEKETMNIKYGNVCVIAKYIIINGIQPYADFVNGLNGTYSTVSGCKVQSDNDITQYTRRITGIIKIDENEIAILFNKGILNNTREYEQYIAVSAMKCNFEKAIKTLKGDALYTIEEKTLQDVIDNTNKIADNVTNKISNPDDIPQDLQDYGTRIIDAKSRDISI